MTKSLRTCYDSWASSKGRGGITSRCIVISVVRGAVIIQLMITTGAGAGGVDYIYKTVNGIPGGLMGSEAATSRYVWCRNSVPGGGGA